MRKFLIAIALAAIAAGCGGNGSSGNGDPNLPPGSRSYRGTWDLGFLTQRGYMSVVVEPDGTMNGQFHNIDENRDGLVTGGFNANQYLVNFDYGGGRIYTIQSNNAAIEKDFIEVDGFTTFEANSYPSNVSLTFHH